MRKRVKRKWEQISVYLLCIKESYSSSDEVLASLQHPSPYPVSEIPSSVLIQQPGQQLLAVLSCLTGTILLALSGAAEEMIFGFMALLSVLGMFQETPNFD